MKLVSASLWLLVAVAARAQADPRREPVVVTTVLASDGTSIPGVPVHAIRYVEFGAPLVVAGWLRAMDERLPRLRRSRPVFSDPQGRVELLLPNGRTVGHYVFAGAPFAGSLQMQGEPRQLSVVRLEQFTVAVVGVDGAPLADFPVALYADRREHEYAWTDQTGLAVFGLPADFEARLTITPAGWIGSREGMPTIAKGLPRARATLVVPAFGSVRVRALIGGAPQLVVFEHAALEQPVRTFARGVQRAGPVKGIEFGPIALGQEVGGLVRGSGIEVRFAGHGPTKNGQCVVLDADLTPAQAATPKPQPQVPAPAADATPRPASEAIEAFRARIKAQRGVPVLPRHQPVETGELALSLTNVPAGAEHTLRCEFENAAGRTVGQSMLHWQRSGGEWRLQHELPAGKVSVRLFLHHKEVHRVDGVEVPASGLAEDARLQGIDVGALVRASGARVRVVDQDGIPVLGARFELRFAPMSVGGATSDESGYALLSWPAGAAPRIVVRAEGMRSRELHGIVDGAVIALQPEAWLTVELAGLPPDLPRERLSIMLRHVVRERLDASVQAAVGDGDRVRLPLPVDGRYRVLLLLASADGPLGGWSMVAEHEQQIDVGDTVPGAICYAIDAEVVDRLRKALAKR